MNTAAKGSRNERRSICILEAAGYSCTRAAASLGVWDIIGIGSTDMVLLQVKTRDWPGSVEMEGLRNFPAPHSLYVYDTTRLTGGGLRISEIARLTTAGNANNPR